MILLAKEAVHVDPAVQHLWALPVLSALLIPLGLGTAVEKLRHDHRGAFVGISSVVITLGVLPVAARLISVHRYVDDPFIYLVGLPLSVALLFLLVAWIVSSLVGRFPSEAQPR